MVYEHGGDVYRNKVRLDFSVNTNPLGMSENVKKVIAENIEQFGIYPDAMCINLRNAIAEKEQVGIDNVLCSNGAAEMIFAVVRAVMPKKTLLLAPTFSEYERALKSVGSQICYYYLNCKMILLIILMILIWFSYAIRIILSEKLQIKKRLNILRRFAMKGKSCVCLTSALWIWRTDIR